MNASIIKSTERTMAVLEYFSEHRVPASVGEVAQTLGLPQSSTSMLLRSLVALGYLDQAPATRKFRPTYRVALLGDWLRDALYERSFITDMMEEIRNETGETVMLGLQNGPHMQYVHIVEANYAVQLMIEVGTLRPMTCSAMGQVLLSLKKDAEIRAIVRRNNADAEDAAHRVREREFLREIDDIRTQGYAESGGRMTPGANAIAMLVPADSDTPPISIGVGGPAERIDEERNSIIDVMRRHLTPGLPQRNG
ncbi:MAG: IclR family transcriptional regulator [Parvibaculum sp.]|nr:IclR family transcriptional regulator [Parvibaculum sp.]